MELTKEQFREEVNRFRGTAKEDAVAIAAQSVRLEKRGPVAVIVFDQHQEKANKLSSLNMLRLFEIFTEIEADPALRAIVLISRKPTIFIAGADISEIQRFSNGEASPDTLMKLQAVFTYLERMKLPSIAAIHGATMGGGTELILACDYRLASDAPETKIGLPEVLLGVIPGWGGTQRLPRLVGLEKSLDLILTGKTVDAKRAKKIGLVDRIVAKEFLEGTAIAWAEELARGGKKRPRANVGPGGLLEKVPGGRWLIFDQARKQVLLRTRGHYPAPLKAIDVIAKTYGGNLDKGLLVEAKAFNELVVTEQCKNLIQVFYLKEKVKKDKGTKAEALTVERAGVLGAGIMGGGIAQLFADKGIQVRMKDLDWNAITRGYQAALKIFKKRVERKKMRPNELDNAMARIEGTTSYAGFKHLDVVVEAIVEDLNVKKKVLAELEGHAGPKTVFATNTSSLSVSAMGEALKDPSRLVGMHFFNPVDKMPLVEVIRGKESSEEAVATVFQLAKKLGKTPILVKDSPGFLVNRILAPYLAEAMYLMADGVEPTRMDDVAERFGMPMGPATLLDEIGLDVAVKVVKVLYGAFGERMKPPPIVDLIASPDRLGKKNGKGIYLWQGKEKRLDPELFAKASASASKTIDDATVEKRLFYLMVNEAARCVEEELVRDPADIDIGMIFGTGFPPFRGGLLRWADSVGAGKIVSELELLARNTGPRFQPAMYLQQLAVKQGRFFPK
jgi:3-hydroxyacyl-CoA dehydrogenase/enoyl-CoA hydratase/3-hydroxybutyryl-CoA epimerase